MPGRIEKIVVAGDVTIDWLQWRVKARDPVGAGEATRLNWELYQGTRMEARPGGALLLAAAVAAATGQGTSGPKLRKKEAEIPPEEILHSMVMLDRYPCSTAKEDEENFVFRIREELGYTGPSKINPRAMSIPVKKDAEDAALVVIDDAGNGFRDSDRAWPQAVTVGRPIVILKRSRPFSADQLWRLLRQAFFADRLVVVLNADHLRSEGVNISRRLSWERTAKDLLWQLSTNQKLRCLKNLRNLVVQVGLEGAVHYCRDRDEVKARLYYDPVRLEGDFNEADCHGKMSGLTIAFVAALAGHLWKKSLDLGEIGKAVREGIKASRRWLRHGFGEKEDDLKYPISQVFGTPDETRIAEIDIPLHCNPDDPDPYFWTILQDLTGASLREAAEQIVQKGIDSQTHPFPVARFGKLTTLDRAEIESLHSIKNIMTEYLKEPRANPLSLAVFGPPGSGKSFAVTQVAKGIKLEGMELKTLEFNLSQWQSPRDLISAFHQVRDAVLGGEMPLVFFDEFDSEFQGPLGWLKYFLDPMQSGKFKEGEIIHPIGKSIFVFAGGTSGSLKEFGHEELFGTAKDTPQPSHGPDLIGRLRRNSLSLSFTSRRGDQSKPDLSAVEKNQFKAAKGPDFISRLKGYLNIFGVNRCGPEDNLYLIRRAVVWRTLFEGIMEKSPQLFSGSQLRIHPGVLWAFLMIPRYKHGTRSMEAILNMSELSDRRMFEQAALPPEVQLDLHVNAQVFRRLLPQQVIYNDNRELLAQRIHEKYLEDQRKAGKTNGDRAMKRWIRLEKDLKDSNRRQADQILEKLIAVGCVFLSSPVGRKPAEFKFTRDEIEFLAEMEHARWMAEKISQGWKYGPDKVASISPPTHPYIVPWDYLEEKIKDNDRNAVRAIPELLKSMGWMIQRTESWDHLNAEK